MKATSFEITIPVLNEESTLEHGIRESLNFFDRHGLGAWRLVIADNGSQDATPDIARELCREFPGRVRYLRIPERGVGLAIRHSWNDSDADVVGYMDVDLATDLNHLLDVKRLFVESAATVVNGSRLLPDSRVIGRKPLREITSRGLNMIMRYVLKCTFTDAMCGFKFFKRELALELLHDIPRIPDWFVSAELLVRAEWQGDRVQEVAVTWTDDSNSKAKVGKLTYQYLGHIKRLRKEMRA